MKYFYLFVCVLFALFICSCGNSQASSQYSNGESAQSAEFAEVVNSEDIDRDEPIDAEDLVEEVIEHLNAEIEKSSNSDTEPVIANENAKDITLEGTLIMQVIRVDGTSERVYKHVETDWMNDYLAFILEVNKPANVKPYLDKCDFELLDPDATFESFMVYPSFDDARKFAEKYANKQVRITGPLHVPGGGWRNATEVILNISEIELVK